MIVFVGRLGMAMLGLIIRVIRYGGSISAQEEECEPPPQCLLRPTLPVFGHYFLFRAVVLCPDDEAHDCPVCVC